MLHGRDGERARLLALVDTARHGRAGSLLLRGEPGVGKSALIADLVSATPAALVLRTQGVEAESPLAFAALQRLVRPLHPLVDQLPAPQAHALRVAFGQEGGVAEPFLVAVATLTLLTEAAEDRLVLCIVDDAHWLDAASRDALLFATRRLDADRVAILFAARDTDEPGFVPEGIPVVTLRGLDGRAARALLAENARGALSDDVVDRLLAETGGNPLALLELPTALSDAQLSGAALMPPQLELTAGVERVFLDRSRRLGPSAQRLLLVAVADDTGELATVRRAATSLGLGADALTEVERSGLVVVTGGTVAVRHPLVRSAVYQAATDADRRAAHRAIAAALEEVHDTDRATWHRAIATDGPDEGLARALGDVGARAELRGGYQSAADAYERAAQLSADPRSVAADTLLAAQNAYACGQSGRASALAAAARERADDPLLLADIERLRGRIAVNVGSADDAHRIFTRAAEAVAVHDPVRALEMAVAVAVAQSHGVDSGARLAPDVVDTGPSPADAPRTRCLKQLLVSTRYDLAGDPAAALAELHTAMDTALRSGQSLGDLDLLGNLANAALHLGDDEAHGRFYALMLATARENGDVMAVLYALQRLSFSQYVAGQWAGLRSSSEEAVTLGHSVGQAALTTAPQAWLVLLSALQGDPDLDVRLAELEDLVAAHPPVGILVQPVEDLTRWARALGAMHAGNPGAAVHHFRQMQLPALALMAAQDRIDAAVRAEETATARAWTDELATFASANPRPWASAAAAYGAALSSSADGATRATAVDELFESSLALHSASRRPYDRARAQQAYGEYLRRQQRRTDARTHLRAALATFEDLHARPLVDRVGEELRASGETARRREPSTALDLTPMELKVAGLVSRGLSNKEVAAQCWVSPRTVAFHLRNVFTKTGITSRTELAHLDLR